MAAVEVTISGVLYDKTARTTRPVVLIGEASLTGLGVGGGPLPGGGGGPVDPGYGYPERPVDPGYGYPIRPVDPGYGYPIGGRPHPEHPIVLPLPPTTPNLPPPGSPPVIVGGTQPVQPITPPEAVLIEYPGLGKVVVPKPTETQPAS